MAEDKLLHRHLSYETIGVLMDVHNNLGFGWDEYAYHEAALEGLKANGIGAKGKLGGQLYHRDILADVFELDILVQNRIILELKHLDSGFAEAHFVQVINYLKFWRKDLGILVDFGHESLRYQRVPFTPAEGKLELAGPWDQLEERNPTARKAAAMFRYILQTHGLGYGVETNRRLFQAESQFHQIPCGQPTVHLAYRGRDLGLRQTKAFLLGPRLLVSIATHPETTSATDLSRLRSYMKQMDIGEAILANFGKKTLTLRAVLAN